MSTYKLPLAPRGAPLTCSCELEFDTDAETVTPPDLAACAFTIHTHKATLESADQTARTMIAEERKRREERKEVL